MNIKGPAGEEHNGKSLYCLTEHLNNYKWTVSRNTNGRGDAGEGSEGNEELVTGTPQRHCRFGSRLPQ